ncbi:MAG: hypothetical protein HRU20_24715 [Pseudomonadales bacterium]|nr:hypothetical protein [Pseudomonadales bacterium]
MDLSRWGFKLLNPAMNTLLRSPLHGVVSRRLMAIEYTGVKSGKAFSVPVSYFRKEGHIYCFTDGRWWNNFKTPREVQLIIEGKAYKASAVAIRDDRPAFIDVLASLIHRFPRDARYYGVQLGADRKPVTGELELAADNQIMVKFSLDD